MQVTARLLDAAASSPASAPVVARIQKQVVIGKHSVPAGSEIHGKTRGANGIRVLVEFSFIRRKSGPIIYLDAVARGRDGRLGVPGRKLVDTNTGVAVAAEGAGSAVAGAARRLAEATGESVGSDAIRDMGREAGSKRERFDHEERIVIAKRGTRFVVYIKTLKERK